jgi:hypothetical protein
MSLIVSEQYQFVSGVDTHAATHTVTVLTAALRSLADHGGQDCRGRTDRQSGDYARLNGRGVFGRRRGQAVVLVPRAPAGGALEAPIGDPLVVAADVVDAAGRAQRGEQRP